MNITEKDIEAARKLISAGEFEASGYRIAIKSIFVETNLDESLKSKYPELAKADFQDKSVDEAGRQSRGTHFGIVASTGSCAYKGRHLTGEIWANEGDVVVFERYAGIGVMMPPGSENEIRFMNDENIMGRMINKDGE